MVILAYNIVHLTTCAGRVKTKRSVSLLNLVKNGSRYKNGVKMLLAEGGSVLLRTTPLVGGVPQTPVVVDGGYNMKNY